MTTRFHIGADEWPGISKLVEECGEVLQLAGKLIANEGKSKHWDGQDLKARITEELGQLLAAITFVRVHAKLDPSVISEQFAGKLALYEKWHRDQQARESQPGAFTLTQDMVIDPNGHKLTVVGPGSQSEPGGGDIRVFAAAVVAASESDSHRCECETCKQHRTWKAMGLPMTAR